MTKEVSILNTKGSAVGQMLLDEKVFGVEPNLHVMHLALRRQLNNGRSGVANAKTRAEVSGAEENPGNKKEQAAQEPVHSVHLCLQAEALSLGPKPEITASLSRRKQEDLLLNQLYQQESKIQFSLKTFQKSMSPKQN